VLLAHDADMDDVLPSRDRHLVLTHEHERRVSIRFRGAPAGPVREELAAAFALHDAADVKDDRPIDAPALTEAIGGAILRHVHADAEDVARNALVAETRVHKRALLLG